MMKGKFVVSDGELKGKSIEVKHYRSVGEMQAVLSPEQILAAVNSNLSEQALAVAELDIEEKR